MAIATTSVRAAAVGRTDRSGRAIVAGLVASTTTLVICAIGCGVASVLARVQLADSSYLHVWLQTLTTSELFSWTGPLVSQALGLYMAAGLAAGLAYAEVFESRLTGSVWERGLVFSTVPNAINLLIALPLLGAGPLGFGIGAGPLILVASTILCAVYGLILAALSGPLAAIGQSGSGARTPDDQQAQTAIETAAANGVVAGLVVGAVIGLGSAMWADMALATHGPVGLAVAGGICGAAVGGLIGSFIGLGETLPAQ